jgi:hypothetical protein
MKVEEPETPKSHKDIAIDQLNEQLERGVRFIERKNGNIKEIEPSMCPLCKKTRFETMGECVGCRPAKFYLETPQHEPELVEGGERRFTIDSIAKTPEFEAIPEGTRQIVKGYFSTEFVWRVPKGINLHDEETYEFGDKWGVLYISNKKTKEQHEVSAYDDGGSDDFKRAHDLEVLEDDITSDDEDD